METLTQKEINKRGNEKIAQLQSLAKTLKIGITSAQSVGSNGIISNIIIYSDLERYTVKNEPETKVEPKKKVEPMKVKKISNIKKKDV